MSILSRGLFFWVEIFEELLPGTRGRGLLSDWFAQECVFTFRRIVWPSYSAGWSLRSLHLFKGQTAAGGCDDVSVELVAVADGGDAVPASYHTVAGGTAM